MLDTTAQEIAKLVSSALWPGVATLLVFHFRKPLSDFLVVLTERARDRNTDFTISKAGVEIKQNMSAVAGRIESLETELREVRALLPTASAQGAAPPTATATIPFPLQQAANAYLGISVPSLGERIRLKDDAAADLTRMVQEYNVSKDFLALQTHEGLLLALIGAIHSNPEIGDLDRLIAIAPRVQRTHVMYKLTMAIGRLFERNLASAGDVGRATELLKAIAKHADSALLERVERTRAIIDVVSRPASPRT